MIIVLVFALVSALMNPTASMLKEHSKSENSDTLGEWTINDHGVIDLSTHQQEVIQLVLQQRQDLEALSKRFLRLENSYQKLKEKMQDQSEEIRELQEVNERLTEDLNVQTKQLNLLQDTMEQEKGEKLFTTLAKPDLSPNASSTISPHSSDEWKRSDDAGPLAPVVNHLSQQLTEVTSEVQALKNANTILQAAQGTTYVRWGHASCPSTASLVFSGILAGSHHSSTGGAANHLCMTLDPVYDNHKLPTGNPQSGIYGSEYEICPEPECNTTPTCAMCRTSHSSIVMIPGTNSCTAGWTKEYSGYIMAGWQDHTASSEYICVDSGRQYLPGSQVNDSPNTIFYTKAACGALPCPPYVESKLVLCVVCSK